MFLNEGIGNKHYQFCYVIIKNIYLPKQIETK